MCLHTAMQEQPFVFRVNSQTKIERLWKHQAREFTPFIDQLHECFMFTFILRPCVYVCSTFVWSGQLFSIPARAPLRILIECFAFLLSRILQNQNEPSLNRLSPPHPQTGRRNVTCRSFPESILHSLAFGLEVSALTGREKEKKHRQNGKPALARGPLN